MSNLKKTILVYDDEESILEVIKIILQDNGYRVVTYSTNQDISKDIEKCKPSLILLDIWMKGTNGNELAVQLKSDKATKDIPIILISALNEGEQIANTSLVDGFLKKPFDMEALIDLVNKHTV